MKNKNYKKIVDGVEAFFCEDFRKQDEYYKEHLPKCVGLKTNGTCDDKIHKIMYERTLPVPTIEDLSTPKLLVQLDK